MNIQTEISVFVNSLSTFKMTCLLDTGWRYYWIPWCELYAVLEQLRDQPFRCSSTHNLHCSSRPGEHTRNWHRTRREHLSPRPTAARRPRRNFLPPQTVGGSGLCWLRGWGGRGRSQTCDSGPLPTHHTPPHTLIKPVGGDKLCCYATLT